VERAARSRPAGQKRQKAKNKGNKANADQTIGALKARDIGRQDENRGLVTALQALEEIHRAFPWACARGARFSPGSHIGAFSPDNWRTRFRRLVPRNPGLTDTIPSG